MIYGDGRQTRDFVYVGDVVEALIAAVGHDGGVFNVGTGAETTVLELHQACAEVAGRAAEPRLRAGAPRRRATLGARRRRGPPPSSAGAHERRSPTASRAPGQWAAGASG